VLIRYSAIAEYLDKFHGWDPFPYFQEYRVSFLQPWSPANIDEVAAIDTVLNVTITAFDVDTDPDLSFSIDWGNSRAVKQGFPVQKEYFEG